MTFLRARTLLLIALVAALAVGMASAVMVLKDPDPDENDSTEARPRLAVLVVFDQMRGDYLARWGKLMGDDGFRRLERDGASFTNCHYPYAITITAPGHASMATGCSPYKHGIIENDWHDRASRNDITAVLSGKYRPVPLPRDLGKQTAFGTPERRQAPSIGESLHRATGGKGKVVSLSIKDRAAILLAALAYSICYWFNPSSGDFGTSNYYTTRPRPWVEQFNRLRVADKWFGKQWHRLRSDLNYTAHSGPDDVREEGGDKQGRTFPHAMSAGLNRVGKDYYERMVNSPFGNELLLELAKKAIDAERLGQGDEPDLLCLGFSCTDMVGHTWGPDSHEVLDVTLRSDRIVKELLDYLDAKVGKGRYLFVVCSDHGICPLPSVARAQGKEAGRIDWRWLTGMAQQYLSDRFTRGKKQPWIEPSQSSWLYLNAAVLREQGLKSDQVAEALASWLRKQQGVQAAYTRSQMLKGPLTDDPIGEMMRRSFHPDRSGDVTLVPKAYHLFSPWTDTGTTHFTPHPYDTHVPLLVYGPGVRAGRRDGPVTPLAVASILARGLRIDPPAMAEAPVPEGLMP